MATRYESTILVSSLVSEDQFKTLIEEYKDFMKKNEVEIVHEENWGLKKLAYPIEKKKNAYYYLLEYNAKGEFMALFDLKLGRDEQIIRHLHVKLDKDAIAYSQKRREKQKETK